MSIMIALKKLYDLSRNLLLIGYLSDKLKQRKVIMISGICFCAILNTSLLFIDAHHINTENVPTDSLITTLHCNQGDEKVDKSFVSNKTLPFQLLVGYTMNIRIPIIICNECQNVTSNIFKTDADQLILQVREKNWISITQLDNSMSLCKYCTKDCLESVLQQSLQQHTNQHGNRQHEKNNDLHRPGLWIFVAVLLGAKIWYYNCF